MQKKYNIISCVWILGHAEPQNWFDPSVGRVVWLKYLFGTGTIYSDILFWTFLFKNTKFSIKKKKRKKKPKTETTLAFPIFWAGRKRANKHFFKRYNQREKVLLLLSAVILDMGVLALSSQMSLLFFFFFLLLIPKRGYRSRPSNPLISNGT